MFLLSLLNEVCKTLSNLCYYMETWIQTNKLEWVRWSQHQKLYCFTKYVKYYQLNPVAAELWQCVKVCMCACTRTIVRIQ